jgi:hypothetical protein
MEADKWEKPFYILVTFSRALLFYFSTTSHSAHVSERKHATALTATGREVQRVTAAWVGGRLETGH